jgi:hypothetical protein
MAQSTNSISKAGGDEIIVNLIGHAIVDSLNVWGLTYLDYAYGYVYETTWSADLTEMLKSRGVEATHQQRYPGSRKTCDIVVKLNSGAELWIEIKGAWYIFGKWENEKYSIKKNGSFSKHLYEDTYSAVHDVCVKLNTIGKGNRHTAFLLIGFDQEEDSIDKHLQAFIEKTCLHSPEWHSISADWKNIETKNCRTRCRWWHKFGHTNQRIEESHEHN